MVSPRCCQDDSSYIHWAMIQEDKYFKMIFMHNNSPLHSAKKINDYLNKVGFKNTGWSGWPLCQTITRMKNYAAFSRERFTLKDSNLLAKMNFEMLFQMLCSLFKKKETQQIILSMDEWFLKLDLEYEYTFYINIFF